jgi:DNA-binding GntR family transcriptional regulator
VGAPYTGKGLGDDGTADEDDDLTDGAPYLNEGAKSLTEGVFERLREDILKCRLEPGARLRIAEICARFGVSVHAVREALSRLASEALVVAEPQRGFKVAPVSVADLEQLTETRIDIESIALRRSIANASVPWESALVAALHQVVNLPKHIGGNPYEVSEDWTAAHSAFHTALVSACGNRWLLWLRGILFDHSERYRRLSAPAEGGVRDTDSEHTALVKAALARNADLAVELLTKHLTFTKTLVMQQSEHGWSGDGTPQAAAANGRSLLARLKEPAPRARPATPARRRVGPLSG